MKLKLATPNWDSLLGEWGEAAWIADRDRKMGNASTTAANIRRTFDKLRAHDALFTATPEILLSCPYAATWYVSLAGYSLKTLGNISERPTHFGMTHKPVSLVEKFARGNLTTKSIRAINGSQTKRNAKDAANIAAFAEWITEEIAQKFPPKLRDPQWALINASLILGGRIIGRGQNEGGEDAVVLVKGLLFAGLSGNRLVEVETSKGDWKDWSPEYNIATESRLRFGKRLVCEFVSGGNRPDIKVYLDNDVVAVGEIKGRKDLSNVWESWMPQVVGHMKTWAGEFPQAARLFFGTLINPSMVEGESRKGTKHTGLRDLYESGQLSGAYNVSKTIEGEQGAKEAFDNLVTQFARLLQ